MEIFQSKWTIRSNLPSDRRDRGKNKANKTPFGCSIPRADDDIASGQKATRN
jgi:hypothetical protein